MYGGYALIVILQLLDYVVNGACVGYDSDVFDELLAIEQNASSLKQMQEGTSFHSFCTGLDYLVKKLRQHIILYNSVKSYIFYFIVLNSLAELSYSGIKINTFAVSLA